MKYVTWVGMAFVSLIMLMGGALKLSGNPMALESFSKLGLPDWFAIFIGAAEIAGAIGIWVQRTSLWAALGIAVVMLGAIYYHVAFPPLSSAEPAVTVLAVCVFIIVQGGTGIIGWRS